MQIVEWTCLKHSKVNSLKKYLRIKNKNNNHIKTIDRDLRIKTEENKEILTAMSIFQTRSRN